MIIPYDFRTRRVSCRVWAGIALAFWLLLFPAAVFAASPLMLTLAEAVRIAGEKNRDIQKAQEYIRWTEGKYVEERAAALPQFVLAGSAGRNRDASQRVFDPNYPTAIGQYGGSVRVTQALFTWGQVGAAIRAAKEGRAFASEQLRQYRQAVQREVITAFTDILLARELLNLASQNVDQKNRHLEEARRKFSLGVATDYDILAATVARDNAKPDLIRAQNLLHLSREKLRFLLALEGVGVDAVGDLHAPAEELPSYEEALAKAKQKRPDLSALHRRQEIAKEALKIADSQDRPRIDALGEYGWTRREPVGLNALDGEAWSMGVQITFPFFDGLRARGRVTQAESDIRSLAIEEARLMDTIRLQIRDAHFAVHEASEIVRALDGTVGQAERLLAMAEKGYALGVKTRLDVDDAEYNLLQARGNLSKAHRDTRVARTTLVWVQGTLGEDP
jgi:outer membrane protein TolC